MAKPDYVYECTSKNILKPRPGEQVNGGPITISCRSTAGEVFMPPSPIEPPTETRPMWIKGAPTEPGNYWVMHTDHEPGRGEATKGPHIMEFLARGNGRLCAFVTGCEIEIEIWNYGPIGIASETAWIVAHQPIAEPEAYAP